MLNSFSCAEVAGIFLLALAGCSTEATPVGDYVVSDSNSAFLIQFTRVEGDAVEGVLTAVHLDKKGDPQSNTVPLSGTLRDHSINLVGKIGSGVFATSSNVIGTFSDDDLRITLVGNGKSVPMTLHRAEPDAFPKLVEQLAARSSQIHQTANAQTQVRDAQMRLDASQSEITHLTDRVTSDIQQLSLVPAKISADAEKYAAMRQQISQLQIEKRHLPNGSAVAGVRASQIDIEINGIRREAEQKHRDIQNYWASLQTRSGEAANMINAKIANCVPSLRQSCDILETTFGGYEDAVARVGDAVSKETIAFNARSKEPVK